MTVPVPERLTADGPPLVLLAMSSAALRMPCASGVKITRMMQLAPAATVGPQSLLSEKSPPLVPPSVIAERFSATVPVLVSLTACEAPALPTAWLPKLRLSGGEHRR